jgi:hypothetical protein
MSYDIKAIPTIYAGVQFRSRLEAKWAAFFDLCGWGWDYEPFDLDGWAPDFMLKGKIKTLVEVKPINFAQTETGAMTQAKAQAAKAFKTASAVCENKPSGPLSPPPQYEIIVIGNGPFENEGSWSLGVMALEKMMGHHDVADLFFGRLNRLDYAARCGSYQYRIGGEHDGDHHLSRISDTTPQDVWREACNIVQWKPPVDGDAVRIDRPRMGRASERYNYHGPYPTDEQMKDLARKLIENGANRRSAA